MKIQLESVEMFEDIFKEMLGTEENAKHSQAELDVLMHIKNLFLKNVEIGGEELDIGQVTQEKLERKKEHASLVAQVEEAEKSKTSTLKTLCTLRKELPLRLKDELTEHFEGIVKQIKQARAVVEAPEAETCDALDEEIARIQRTVSELTGKLPAVISQVKENMSYVEKEVKDRIEQKGREIEAESLSLLFKDELELPE
ncbi:uncharacterized protein NEMAJ01_1374 [Nematocida major]|uniref:uncharacterized protein n=1 Tax=Nematocida major TaxID=1912982 RepID=UPI002007EA31|nr:uncharacterized protein NEMAJ01_1374 [Nematocida major]KAH9386478.1 hypothetical protein NEMAJ01_1374 [Nematocida major]